jgi:type II secretory pathway pseudopilin PulG
MSGINDLQFGGFDKFNQNESKDSKLFDQGFGFTVVEVIVAVSIMIILCIGTLSAFSFVVKLNQGNNLRSQALTVLQAEAELYRSYKFVPDSSLTALELQAGTRPQKNVTSRDNTPFVIDVTVINIPDTASEAECTFKEIRIVATPVNPRPAWLADVQTQLTIQRVRSN